MIARFAAPALALALAASLAGNVASWAKLSAERNAHNSFRTATAERVAAAERERADLAESRRKTEQELIDAQETHATEVAAIRSELDAARTAGRVGSIRVRDAARATAALAGEACAATTSAAVREAASRSAVLLADLFAESEQRATELAATADDRGIAGRACVRLYESARTKVNASP